MPTVQLKPEKPFDEPIPASNAKRLPIEYFGSVPAKLLDGLEIGDSVTVTFRGKVTALSLHKHAGTKNRGSLDLETKSIGLSKKPAADPEIDELAD